MDGLRRHDKKYVKGVMHTHLENQMEGVREVIREQEENA
jgi:hypothetical protein